MSDCCWSEIYQYSTLTDTITHAFDGETTITVGGKVVALAAESREYEFRVYVPGMKADQCPSAGNTPSDAHSTLADTWTAKDVEVIFIDPRHDHIVYREHTVHINYGDTANSVIGISYPLYPQLEISVKKTTRTVSTLLGVLEETEEEQTVKLDLVMNLDNSHVQERFVPEAYYSYNLYVEDVLDLDNKDRDGWYFGFPYYLHDYFFNRTIHYDRNKVIEGAARAGIGEAVTTVKPEFLADDYPQGSWVYDRDGNLFVSQLLKDGTLNILRTKDGITGDPVTLTELLGSNPVFYPIAPL